MRVSLQLNTGYFQGSIVQLSGLEKQDQRIFREFISATIGRIIPLPVFGEAQHFQYAG